MHYTQHHVYPDLAKIRVVFAVKNFAAVPGVSHIGLGVTATTTMKTLRRNGVHAEAWSCRDAPDLARRLIADHAGHHHLRHHPITHVIVSAPSWVQPDDFNTLALTYPNIEFVQLNHSGCAFLSIDRNGIRNIKAVGDLSLMMHNVRLAGNNPRFTAWASESFGVDCLLLPNLYDVRSFVPRYVWPKPRGHVLKIGSFGAWRAWKNQLTAAEAAVQLARRLGVDLELYVNSGRTEGEAGQRMGKSRQELFEKLRGCKLINVPWERWAKFRQTVSTMHLLFQPSFSETFNVVSADGLAAGVATVASSAIEWLPSRWHCDTDDPSDMVRVALYLLNDTHAIEDARRKLTEYAVLGLSRWKAYLNGNQEVMEAP